MPRFIYKAKQGPQKIVEGVIEADNIDVAIVKICEAGYTPIEVKGKEDSRSQKEKTKSLVNVLLSFSKKVPSSQIALFTRQVSDLIDAGVPILQALNIVEKQTTHPKFKNIISDMCLLVKDGGTFSGSLSLFPDVFSSMYVNMVKAGEVGGNLDSTMNRLADFIEKDQETVSKVRTSLIYPALITVVGGITIFALLTWVIPKITMIFDDMGTSLPLSTRMLMATSDFLSRFWWMVLGIMTFCVIYLKRILKTSSGRLSMDRIKLRMPVFGGLIKDAEMGRFARILGTLVGNGVNIVTALESTELVVENHVFKNEVREIASDVASGQSISNALRGKTFFSDASISMVAVSEESGNLHEGLYKLASFYERQTEKVIKRILSLIEPILILVLGTVVGFVVIAMLMPMFRMNLIVQ